MTRIAIRGASIAAVLAAGLALCACRPASSGAPASSTAVPPLSGTPTTTYTPASSRAAAPASSLQVNPPTAGAPPANAGDAQVRRGLGPGGPVNLPHHHDSTDGERG